MPTGFFDDESEEKEKMVEIGYQKNPSAPTLASLEKEKINPRLKNQKKDGPRIKGVGVAKDLPAGFYDDKTKDANIRGVETPADKEKRLVFHLAEFVLFRFNLANGASSQKQWMKRWWSRISC